MMTGGEVIKSIMRMQGVTQGEIAEKVGIPGQQRISGLLSRDMRISVLVKFANELGYEVILDNGEHRFKVGG